MTQENPNDLTRTVEITQPSCLEPALRLRRYSDVSEGNILEVVDEDGAILSQVGADGQFPGGGSVPAQETLSGDPVTIVASGNANLTWDTKGSGNDLLDLSTPDAPTVIADGVYAVTIQVNPHFTSPLTVGATFQAILSLNSELDVAFTTADSSPASVANAQPCVSLTVVSQMTAGDAINAQVTNWDGAASVDYVLSNAIVQKF